MTEACRCLTEVTKVAFKEDSIISRYKITNYMEERNSSSEWMNCVHMCLVDLKPFFYKLHLKENTEIENVSFFYISKVVQGQNYMEDNNSTSECSKNGVQLCLYGFVIVSMI